MTPAPRPGPARDDPPPAPRHDPPPGGVTTAWRLTRRPYANLSGEGGRRYAARWHSAGRPVVYLAEHPALAVLEVLVGLDVPRDLLPDDFVLMELAWDAALVPEPCPLDGTDPGARAFGDAWLAARRSALLRVPSVLAPHAFNHLLNPEHPDAAAVRIVEVTPFAFDPRLVD